MSETRIECPRTLDHETGRTLLHAVRQQKVRKGQTLILDLAPTENMDTLGGAWLVEIAGHLRKRHAKLRLEGQHEGVAEFIGIIQPSLEPFPGAKTYQAGLLERIGGTAIAQAGELGEFLSLCVDAIYWTLMAPFEGRGFRWGNFVDEVHEMGVRAIRIVCLMNFLLGLIIAMLSSAQIASFGLSIYVADLLMIGFARELAAIMTATVVSARTGAAIAAEIATMKVQEEIDALRGMGLNVAQFLVAPKMLALIVVLPCLTMLGLFSGLAGGTLWGVTVLGFQPAVWINETTNAAQMNDLMQGMLKTLFFAVAIVLIGCHNGFRVSGGSRGVGLMTTRAVVMDIFMLICVDIVFAAIFYYVLQ